VLPTVIEEAATEACLTSAWGIVRDSDLADGVPSAALLGFSHWLEDSLEGISHDLLSGTYRPSGFSQLVVAGERHERELHMPAVRDRIVERSLADALTKRIDPWLSPWSFAYRPGLGVTDALRALVELRDSGSGFVARCDVRDCFDRLPRAGVVEALGEWVEEEPLLALVRLLLDRCVVGRPNEVGGGIAQGSPLSPLLCNVYLNKLDEAALRHGYQAIRCSDDIAVPVRDRPQAETALVLIDDELHRMGLGAAGEKSGVMSFDKGFAFLGEEVTCQLPAAESFSTVREPVRRALYVGRDGAGISVSHGQVHVGYRDEVLLTVPCSLVGSMCLFGNVGLSAGARQVALANGVDVGFASRRGTFLGWLQSPTCGAPATRRLQYRLGDDAVFATRLASSLVVGKLANMAALLRRYGAAEVADETARVTSELRRLAQGAASCQDSASLVGIEGAGTAAYFQVFGHLVPEPFNFETRTRRPPTDPVNACLSYGYAVLTAAAVAASAMAGLDPTAGFLHVDAGNRPSMALDVMEEFRPLVVDTTVLRLLRKRSLLPHHFRTEAASPAVLLTEAGRKILVAGLEQRFLTVTSHTGSRQRVSYRRCLFLQARQVASCLHRPGTAYQAQSWR
jgi:CRISPR-associated protein Cas1